MSGGRQDWPATVFNGVGERDQIDGSTDGSREGLGPTCDRANEVMGHVGQEFWNADVKMGDVVWMLRKEGDIPASQHH